MCFSPIFVVLGKQVLPFATESVSFVTEGCHLLCPFQGFFNLFIISGLEHPSSRTVDKLNFRLDFLKQNVKCNGYSCRRSTQTISSSLRRKAQPPA